MIQHCIGLFFTVVKERFWPGSWPTRTHMLKFPLGRHWKYIRLKLASNSIYLTAFFSKTLQPQNHSKTKGILPLIHCCEKQATPVGLVEWIWQSVCPGIWLSTMWNNNIMHRTCGSVCVRVLYGQQVADDWRWSNYRSQWGQNLCHTSGERLLLLHAIFIPSPLAILFPHWYKNIPHVDLAQERERERGRERHRLFSGPKLKANVKMDPSSRSRSFSLANSCLCDSGGLWCIHEHTSAQLHTINLGTNSSNLCYTFKKQLQQIR